MLLVLFCLSFGTIAYTQSCTDYKDCLSCTSHKSWTGENCTYCELPTVITNYVCHDPYDITNPCSFYCPDDNIQTPSRCHAFPPNQYATALAGLSVYLSSVAYAEQPNKCMSANPTIPVLKGWTLYKVFSSPYCDAANSTCFGYAAYSVGEGIIALSFRGTVTVTQLLFETIQGFIPESTWPGGGAVIPYFKNAHESLWPEVLQAVKELVARYPKFPVLVTGHSLGGALASLTASSIALSKVVPTSSIILYTFGEPRVGDYTFAKAFDKLLPNSWRIIHYIDPFPHIPLCEYILVNGPIPICNPCAFPNIFSYHHGTEVWYNITTPNFGPTDPHYVCQTGWPINEALDCSTGQVGYGVDCFKNVNTCLLYHTFYFGVSVSDCGVSECGNPVACGVKKLDGSTF